MEEIFSSKSAWKVKFSTLNLIFPTIFYLARILFQRQLCSSLNSKLLGQEGLNHQVLACLILHWLKLLMQLCQDFASLIPDSRIFFSICHSLPTPFHTWVAVSYFYTLRLWNLGFLCLQRFQHLLYKIVRIYYPI